MYERIQGNDMYNGAINPPGKGSESAGAQCFAFQPWNERKKTGNVITASALPILPLKHHRHQCEQLQKSGELPVQPSAFNRR